MCLANNPHLWADKENGINYHLVIIRSTCCHWVQEIYIMRVRAHIHIHLTSRTSAPYLLPPKLISGHLFWLFSTQMSSIWSEFNYILDRFLPLSNSLSLLLQNYFLLPYGRYFFIQEWLITNFYQFDLFLPLSSSGKPAFSSVSFNRFLSCRDFFEEWFSLSIFYSMFISLEDERKAIEKLIISTDIYWTKSNVENPSRTEFIINEQKTNVST